MSGALMARIADVDRAWRDAVARVWEAIGELRTAYDDLRATQEGQGDQIRSAVEEIQAQRPPSDADLPSPPRDWAAFAVRMKVAEAQIELLFRRVTVLEGGHAPTPVPRSRR